MHDRQDELNKLLKHDVDSEDALSRIEAIVIEQCGNGDGRLFSGFIGVFADAMRLMGERGRIRVTNDNGGRVVEAVIDPRC